MNILLLDIGYENADWFIPPSEARFQEQESKLSPDQIRETLNYFSKYSDVTNLGFFLEKIDGAEVEKFGDRKKTIKVETRWDYKYVVVAQCLQIERNFREHTKFVVWYFFQFQKIFNVNAWDTKFSKKVSCIHYAR